jgi:hypothetical protein
MKQKLYLLGLVTTLIVFMGTLFKVNHWAGAGLLLLAGIFTLVLIFLPLSLINNFKADGNRRNLVLYIVTWLTSFVVFVSMLFKIQHWTGAAYGLIIALPFPYLVFLPVFLIVTSRNKNHNIYHTVYVLFLLVIISCFSALLALNVSKERMVDSIGIVRNYTKVENVLCILPANRHSAFVKKIDDLILSVKEYKDIYLSYYDITSNQWKSDPEILLASGALQKPTDKIKQKAESKHVKLLTELSDLMLFLEKTPGYEGLAKAAPEIFDIGKTPGGSYNWGSDLILYPMQPWLLTYLEGLETNLKLIKVTVK